MNLPVLNEKKKSVMFQGREGRLTPKEYSILKTLLSQPGKTFTPEEIYSSVWQAEPFDCRLVISVHIRHIREKLEKDPSNPACLKSNWGKGYKIVPIY